MRAGRPAPLRALLAAAAAFAFAGAAHGQAAGQGQTPDDGYRYGIPAGLDLAKLVGEPTLLDSEHKAFDDPSSGERRSRGFADVVAVYDIPFGAFVDAASDFAAYSRFLPRIFESTPVATPPPTAPASAASASGTRSAPARLIYSSGIKAMGIEVLYRIIAESSVDEPGEGAIGVRARMVESLDGKLFAQSNSFYLARVSVGGKAMTLVRYYSSLGLREPGALTVKVLSLSAGPEGKAQVKALAEEAAKRAKLGGTRG